MQPSIVHQIAHLPVSGNLEPNLPSGGEAIIGIVLVVSIAVSVFADALSVESLIFEFFSNVSEVIGYL